MIQFIKLYLITTPVFFTIDIIWLGLLAKNFYQKQLGALLGPVNWSAALIFYLLYIIGIIIFALEPALEKNSLTQAVLLGGLLGLIAYSTYDLSNLATLKNWPTTVVFIDIIWGTILTSSVATISFLIAKKVLTT